MPLAVTAFDADDLLEQQIEEASDLQLVVPGLTFMPTAFSGVVDSIFVVSLT